VSTVGVGKRKDTESLTTLIGTERSREIAFELMARIVYEELPIVVGVPVRYPLLSEETKLIDRSARRSGEKMFEIGEVLPK